MHSFLWLWVIPFNWYKNWTIFLPWRIVNILVLADCVFTQTVNRSLMFTMSCSWSRGLMTFWFSFSSGLCSVQCSVLLVLAHWVTRDIWLSPSGKGRTAIRWCQPLPSEFHPTVSVSIVFPVCISVDLARQWTCRIFLILFVLLYLFLNSFSNFATQFLDLHPSFSLLQLLIPTNNPLLHDYQYLSCP